MGMRWVAGVVLLTLAACGKPSGEAPAAADNAAAPGNAATVTTSTAPVTTRTASDPPYDTNLPIKEFMAHVMQYAGDGIWKRQGYITDKNGERSLFPKTDEEWEAAESGALNLAEITNVLLIPGRRVDEPEWTKAVLQVRADAMRAAAAAEKKDADAWFAAGGDLDVACDACHERYAPHVP